MVIFGAPIVGRYGYFRIIRCSFVFKICSGLIMFFIGRSNPWLLMLFILLDTWVSPSIHVTGTGHIIKFYSVLQMNCLIQRQIYTHVLIINWPPFVCHPRYRSLSHTRTHAHTCARGHARTHARHARTHARTHTHTQTHTHTHTHTHAISKSSVPM